LPSASVTSATATMSAPALPAHALLKPIRLAAMVLKVSEPRRPMMKRQGCVLAALGDQRAASRAAVSVCSSMVAVASKARGLQRSERTSRMGTLVSACSFVVVLGRCVSERRR
jgi:hypothetical protein